MAITDWWFEDFTNDTHNLFAIQQEVKYNKLYGILSKVADKDELKFAQFINQFDEFMAIELVVYDKENRKLLCLKLKLLMYLKYSKKIKLILCMIQDILIRSIKINER